MHTPHDGNLGNTNVRIMICSEYKGPSPSTTIHHQHLAKNRSLVCVALRGKFMKPPVGAVNIILSLGLSIV